MSDHYTILEIQRNSSVDDIKKAYKKLAIKYHPDKNPGNKEAEEMFVKINQAHETLIDPEKRKLYDAKTSPSFNFNFYSNMFSDGINRRKASDFTNSNSLKKEAPRGSNTTYDLGLTLEEIYIGITKTIQINRNIQCRICAGTGAKTYETCSVCSGKGFITKEINSSGYVDDCPHCLGSGLQIDEYCDECNGRGIVHESTTVLINVPRGVSNGTELCIAGKGNAGLKGGPYGDLLVKVCQLEHKKFTRENFDIIYVAEVNNVDMILGADIKIPTLDMNTVLITIPPLTNVDTVFRIKDKGLVNRSGDTIGSIFVKTKIIVPSVIQDEVKILYEKIRKLEDFGL